MDEKTRDKLDRMATVAYGAINSGVEGMLDFSYLRSVILTTADAITRKNPDLVFLKEIARGMDIDQISDDPLELAAEILSHAFGDFESLADTAQECIANILGD